MLLLKGHKGKVPVNLLGHLNMHRTWLLELNGARAAVQVDCPIAGNREQDARNKFALPKG